MSDNDEQKVQHTQKLIYKWEELEEGFDDAYDHYVRRTGPASLNDFLMHLVRRGCQIEMVKTKTE